MSGVTSQPHQLSLSVLKHVLVHAHCRDFNIFSSYGLLPSDLVAQSVERRRSNQKVVGSIPTLVRVFLCPCVGPFPSVGLTLTWFIWDRNLALHITLYLVNSEKKKGLAYLGVNHCNGFYKMFKRPPCLSCSFAPATSQQYY